METQTVAMNEYERWEDRFADPDYIFGTAPNAFLAAHKHLLRKHGRALAIADGEGRNGVWLAEQGLDVFSFDFSPTAQGKTRALAQARGVTITTRLLEVADYDWPPDAFDVVADIFKQFSDPAERAQKFAGIRRTLKEGGLLLLQGYRPEQIAYGTGGPKAPENMYTRVLLEREFASFKRIEIEEYDIEMREGSAHSGMSAVINLVGWKQRGAGRQPAQPASAATSLSSSSPMTQLRPLRLAARRQSSAASSSACGKVRSCSAATPIDTVTRACFSPVGRRISSPFMTAIRIASAVSIAARSGVLGMITANSPSPRRAARSLPAILSFNTPATKRSTRSPMTLPKVSLMAFR